MPSHKGPRCHPMEDSTLTERFSETLRRQNRATWSAAVGHRFVRELCDGSVADPIMVRYLVQDHRFIDSFVTLLGAAIATADTFEARLRIGRFVGMICSDENTYFLRAFEALDVSPAQRTEPADSPPTAGFKALMREAAATRSYAAALSVLNVAEGLYLDWATQARKPLPGNFVHAEWITLHDNPAFADFVAFLQAELDRVGPQEAARSSDFYARAVALELAFFDAIYEEQA
ncbi:TenA family protein [Pseudomonas plecoglossicida]